MHVLGSAPNNTARSTVSFNLKDKSILLIDPNQGTGKAIDGIIRPLEPGTFRIVATVADAIARCRNQFFDLILCEHQLN